MSKQGGKIGFERIPSPPLADVRDVYVLDCWVPQWRKVLDGSIPHPPDHRERIEAERQMMEKCYQCKTKCKDKEI